MRVVTAAAICTLGFPIVVDSCGISPPTPIFVTRTRPAEVANQFAKGRLGILQPTFEPAYLIGAFRHLSGKPLTAAEMAAIYPDDSGRMEAYEREWANEKASRLALTEWQTIRASIAGDRRLTQPIANYKSSHREGLYVYYLNCHNHAFQTAFSVLADLKSRWGEQDERLASWVFAQDQVFANCGGNSPTIPADPTSQMDPLLAAHRRYQIAAALFYAGEFRKAAEAFIRIGRDEADSPWHGIAPYVAARALIRAGELENDPNAYGEARDILGSVLRDQSRAEWHLTSKALLSRLQLRFEPHIRIVELNRLLMQTPANSEEMDAFRQAAIDFGFLLNRGQPARVEAASELGLWAQIIQGSESHGPAAVSWWKRSNSPAWLIAALIAAPDKDLPPLLAEASKIPAGSPAFESITYHAASREARIGHLDQARFWSERGLNAKLSVRSARNMLLAQRAKLARNWSEYLTYGLRSPEPGIADFDSREDTTTTAALPGGAVFAFDFDLIDVFNTATPLRLWMDATRNPALPAYLQFRIAQSGWFRAVLLQRWEAAREFLQRIVELQPAVAETAVSFLNATTDIDRHRAALYVYLRSPGLSPILKPAYVSNENMTRPHTSRACPAVPGADPAPGTQRNIPPFFSPEDRAAAKAENGQLQAATLWHATHTLKETLQWAGSQPDDPRVPEALHRAVRMSFYGCKDEQTGEYSKQAFHLLHKRYARTKWAELTRYWYR